jgi:hypothetical protein
MAETKKKTVAEQPPTAEAPTSTAANLDINVLFNLLKIVDFSFSEGTFKGVDATREVLKCRDHLATFLDTLPKPEAVPAPDAA